MPRFLGNITKLFKQENTGHRLQHGQLAQIAGVMTFANKDVQSVLHQRRVPNEWYGEIEGLLQKDELNPVDADAVNVIVDGVRFGCLPSYLNAGLELKREETLPCFIQVFVREVKHKQTVAAWVWFGPGPPEWEWSRQSFPPMTTEERSSYNHSRSTDMVSEALAKGGFRAEDFKRGMVDGVHYLELVEPIKQLKREGRLEEALALCYQAIAGAESGRNGREPAPAYTIDAAIIHRKLGQRSQEIAVLERWLRYCPEDRREGSRVALRLEKLTGT